MVIAFVEHFLSQEGMLFFPQWITETDEVLSSFQGYAGLEIVNDLEHTDRILLFLRFDTVENLRLWSNSDKHAIQIGKLKPHMLEKPKSQILKVNT